jgi:hypothetical protein
MKRANVSINAEKLNKRKQPKLHFEKMLQNLNAILLGQFFIKTGLHISKRDLIEIQTSDNKLALKMDALNKQHPTAIKEFEMHSGVLYKICTVYDQIVFKLALPNFLARDILKLLHNKSGNHLTLINLIAAFNQNFYTTGVQYKVV